MIILLLGGIAGISETLITVSLQCSFANAAPNHSHLQERPESADHIYSTQRNLPRLGANFSLSMAREFPTQLSRHPPLDIQLVWSERHVLRLHRISGI